MQLCGMLYCEVYGVIGSTGNACRFVPAASVTLRFMVRLPLNGWRGAYTVLLPVFQV